MGGKLSVFTCTRPTVGDGKLRNREGGARGAAPAKPATDGKGPPNLLQPDGEFYKNLAVECSKEQLCVDVWNCNSAYADLASLGQLAKHTGGSIYHYRGFSDVTHGEALSRELQHNLTRAQGLEAVMRVRASRGLKIAAFYGHFFIRGVDLLALPNVDEDKSFAVEIAHEEAELNYANACVQAALLYTTTCGERRIRVLTIQVPITSAISTLYERADVDGCAALMGRIAAEAAVASRPLDGAEKLQNGVTEMLRAYRSLCPPTARNTASLLLPDTLRLLPLYVLAQARSLAEESSWMHAAEKARIFHFLTRVHSVADEIDALLPRCGRPPRRALVRALPALRHVREPSDQLRAPAPLPSVSAARGRAAGGHAHPSAAHPDEHTDQRGVHRRR